MYGYPIGPLLTRHPMFLGRSLRDSLPHHICCVPSGLGVRGGILFCEVDDIVMYIILKFNDKTAVRSYHRMRHKKVFMQPSQLFCILGGLML